MLGSLFCLEDLDSSFSETLVTVYQTVQHLSYCISHCYRYESEGRYVRQVKAQKLWYAICESQVETGTPYMLYKDACNHKSNQQNLGTIKCSNLCTEIVEFTSPSEVSRKLNIHTPKETKVSEDLAYNKGVPVLISAPCHKDMKKCR